jgi:1-acyl-sn-glycerol-3-phosphate acyltransferase
MVYKNTPMKNTKKAYMYATVIFIYFAILIIVHMIVARIFRSKKLIEYVHRKYIYGLSKSILNVLNIEVSIEGTWPKDEVVHIIMSNHVSWLDIFVIGYALNGRSVTAVSKLTNFLIPFFGLGMYMLFVRPMRRNKKDPIGDRKRIKEVFNTCRKYDLDLLFFPEGTRTTDGNLSNFKNGGFELSFVENISIVPMIIHGLYDISNKNLGRSVSPGKVTVVIDDEVLPSEFGSSHELKDTIYRIMNEL